MQGVAQYRHDTKRDCGAQRMDCRPASYHIRQRCAFDKWLSLVYHTPRWAAQASPNRQAEVAKWQTRYVQGVVGVTPWEFKSPLRHHLQLGRLPEPASISLGNSLKVERLILDQVVGVRIPVPQPNQQALDPN